MSKQLFHIKISKKFETTIRAERICPVSVNFQATRTSQPAWAGQGWCWQRSLNWLRSLPLGVLLAGLFPQLHSFAAPPAAPVPGAAASITAALVAAAPVSSAPVAAAEAATPDETAPDAAAPDAAEPDAAEPDAAAPLAAVPVAAAPFAATCAADALVAAADPEAATPRAATPAAATPLAAVPFADFPLAAVPSAAPLTAACSADALDTISVAGDDAPTAEGRVGGGPLLLVIQATRLLLSFSLLLSFPGRFRQVVGTLPEEGAAVGFL